jgi:hypothetical protein
MKSFGSFLILLFISIVANAQGTPKSEFIPTHVDSIRLNVELNRGKELLLPGNETETHELLGSSLLLVKDAKKFIKRIGKKSSYVNGRALLTHHSLVFICYAGENVALSVEISTLTRNINLYNASSESFHGKISKKMGNYLVKLLVRLNLYTPLQEVGDTEGIE